MVLFTSKVALGPQFSLAEPTHVALLLLKLAGSEYLRPTYRVDYGQDFPNRLGYYLSRYWGFSYPFLSSLTSGGTLILPSLQPLFFGEPSSS